jgi:hypothetical protein
MSAGAVKWGALFDTVRCDPNEAAYRGSRKEANRLNSTLRDTPAPSFTTPLTRTPSPAPTSPDEKAWVDPHWWPIKSNPSPPSFPREWSNRPKVVSRSIQN